MSRAQVPQMNRAYLYPLQSLNGMADSVAHSLDLSFSALVYSYSEATAASAFFSAPISTAFSNAAGKPTG